MKSRLGKCCGFMVALVLSHSLGADALQLGRSHFKSRSAEKVEARLAAHLQALDGPEFNQWCMADLRKAGLSPAEAASRLQRTSLFYDAKNGDLWLGNADQATLRVIAETILKTGIGIDIDAMRAPIEAAEAKGDHALAAQLEATLDDGYGSWRIVSAEEGTARKEEAALIAEAASTTPASEPPAAKGRALLLKHYTDPDQTARPQTVATTLARQIAALRNEWLRHDSIEALVKNGSSEQDAAKAFDAIRIRYDVKTRDLYLSGADEQTLRLIAKEALLPGSIRGAIDLAFTTAADAQQRNDTAFLEESGTRTGGHTSLWYVVGMVNAPAASRTNPPPPRQSRWQPPLNTAHLPTQQAAEAAITTDYKTYAPGILIPAGAERAITRGGKITITHIHSAHYYPAYDPMLKAEEQPRKYEYLLVGLSLGTPHGAFESMWHGALVLRKPIEDNHWDKAEVFSPRDAFSKEMADYLSDTQIENLLERRN